ncbi:hypothetical protein D3C75_851760 [compost metagenome]
MIDNVHLLLYCDIQAGIADIDSIMQNANEGLNHFLDCSVIPFAGKIDDGVQCIVDKMGINLCEQQLCRHFTFPAFLLHLFAHLPFYITKHHLKAVLQY